MLTVNMHEAKTRLSELVARAIKGEPFIIANRGKPVVKVEALAELEKPKRQPIGFAKGLWPAVSDEVWAEMDREILQDFENELARDGGNVPSTDSGR